LVKTVGRQTPVLKPGSGETIGRQAQHNNIMAARIISDALKTSIGPRSMDKLLIPNDVDVIVTNDGRTMLQQMSLFHPIGKIMYETTKWTDFSVGDGTTSVVILVGALLEKAEELIQKDVHTSTIIEGYLEAMDESDRVLEQMGQQIRPDDRDELARIAETSLRTKLVGADAPFLAKIVADAALCAAERTPNGGWELDPTNIHVSRKRGGSIRETQLVYGMALDRQITSHAMPRRIDEARIALINHTFEIKKAQILPFPPEIRISSPEQMVAFKQEEHSIFDDMIAKIDEVKANVVICQQGLSDYVQLMFAKRGILAIRRASEAEIKILSRATGGRIVADIEDLKPEDLGFARLVEERRVETDMWLFIEGCKNPKAASILIKGHSLHIIDEVDRAVHDAIMVVKDSMDKPSVVAGGGAPEQEVASKIRSWAMTVRGRKQLAALKFAEALESIPIALANTAGMNLVDSLVELRSAHSDGKRWYGIDAIAGRVDDMYKNNVIEPTIVKQQVIKTAVETAISILRIDGIISSPKKVQQKSTSWTPR
jgi:thermosome